MRLRTILGAALLLRIAHALLTPAWQAPDEFPHYWVAQEWAASGLLPSGSSDFPTYEAYQHPLYYFILAGGLRASGAESLSYSDPPVPLPLPLLAARVFSALLGTLTVGAVWLFVRRIRPDRPDTALLAATVTALLPSFVGVSSTVNNDALAIALASAALLLALPRAEGSPARRIIGAGICAGAALATKLNAVVLLPPLLLFFWWTRRESSFIRQVALLLPGVLSGLVLVVARNVWTYGTLLALPLPGGDAAFNLPALVHAARNLAWSFSIAFGRTYEIHPAPWVYLVTTLPLILLAVLGWWRRRRETPAGREIALLGLSLLLGVAASLLFTLRYPEGAQTSWGKNLYPLLPLIAYGLAFGWEEALPGRRRALPIVALTLCAAGSLWPLFL
jgi:4-amino-4-deoxy-L-arabinose transferase-like glycosyltransferase